MILLCLVICQLCDLSYWPEPLRESMGYWQGGDKKNLTITATWSSIASQKCHSITTCATGWSTAKTAKKVNVGHDGNQNTKCTRVHYTMDPRQRVQGHHPSFHIPQIPICTHGLRRTNKTDLWRPHPHNTQRICCLQKTGHNVKIIYPFGWLAGQLVTRNQLIRCYQYI